MINLTNINLFYGDKLILKDLNLRLKKQQFCFIMGQNGSGKSTLIKLILEQYSDQLQINEVNQNFDELTIPEFTILENLCLALLKRDKARLTPYFMLQKKIVKFAEKFLPEILSFFDQQICHLSGGQRQLVAIFMSLISQPDIILLDEFTSALDEHTKKKVFILLKNYAKENPVTYISVTHNLDDAVNHGDRIIILKNGEICFDREKNQLLNLKKEAQNAL